LPYIEDSNVVEKGAMAKDETETLCLDIGAIICVFFQPVNIF
jgi:hypothetical protein